jgi:hypothetical protein
VKTGDQVMTAYGVGRLVGWEKRERLLFGRPHRELWFVVEFDDGRMVLPEAFPHEKQDDDLGERNGRDDG